MTSRKLLIIAVLAIVVLLAVVIYQRLSSPISQVNQPSENLEKPSDEEAIKTIVTTGPISETNYQSPYPIAWLGWNRAEISLQGVKLSEVSETENQLVLNLKINSRDGGICVQTLKDSIKVILNEKDLTQGTVSSNDCVEAYSTLPETEITFRVPTEVREFTIFGATSKQGQPVPSQPQNLFRIIFPIEGDAKIEPLIG